MQEGHEVLSVAQAASRLGVSPDAVRKRIRRGTLRAWKRDGEWVVPALDVSETSRETRPATVPATVPDTARDAIAYLEAERDRLLRDNDRLLSLTVDQHATIQQLTETVAELQRRLPAPGEATAEIPRSTPTSEPTPEPTPHTTVPPGVPQTSGVRPEQRRPSARPDRRSWLHWPSTVELPAPPADEKPHQDARTRPSWWRRLLGRR